MHIDIEASRVNTKCVDVFFSLDNLECSEGLLLVVLSTAKTRGPIEIKKISEAIVVQSSDLLRGLDDHLCMKWLFYKSQSDVS